MANEELFKKTIALLQEELLFWRTYPGGEGKSRSACISSAIADLSAGNITENVLRALSDAWQYYLSLCLCQCARTPEQMAGLGFPKKTVENWVRKRDCNVERFNQFLELWKTF